MRRVNAAGSILALAAGLLLTPTPALANGQSTHLWISHEAVEHLPDGPLRALLEAHPLMVDNGTMFPDGGYPLDDPYAELAHWEPFQVAYMQWIMSEYAYPYEGDAAEHAAFMLGMNSHGMADQVFDALYMERTEIYDGDKNDLDTQSDIVMMALVGGGFEPPEDWAPYDLFEELYPAAVGYEVEKAKMQTGQSLLRVAILAVASSASNPEDVAEAEALYPWGNSHLLDEEVPGSPPCEGEAIARYWQSQWELMNGRELYRPILTTWPVDGGANHQVDASSIESWVSMAFARGLDSAEIDVEDFEIRSEEGVLLPFDVNVFYGQDSHVVHLKPTENFAVDTIYTVTVQPGVPDIHGAQFEGWSWTFSTGSNAPDPINPPWGEGLDGSDGSEPGGEETGGEESSGGSSSEDGGESLGEATGDDGGLEQNDAGTQAGACACRGDSAPSWPAFLLLFVLPALRPRRPLRPACEKFNLPG
jgi:hypothetical protein